MCHADVDQSNEWVVVGVQYRDGKVRSSDREVASRGCDIDCSDGFARDDASGRECPLLRVPRRKISLAIGCSPFAAGRGVLSRCVDNGKKGMRRQQSTKSSETEKRISDQRIAGR